MSDVTGSASWRPAGHWQTHDGERLYTIAEVREREMAAYVKGALNSVANHLAEKGPLRRKEMAKDDAIILYSGEPSSSLPEPQKEQTP